MAAFDPFRDIVTGYPKLAAKIEIQPEAAIYRRFGALNAQNLLYFQAELSDLEGQLRDQQKSDNDQNNQGSKALYAKNWFRLQNSKVDGDTEQLDLVLKIRDTLKEYSKLSRKVFLVNIAQSIKLFLTDTFLSTYEKSLTKSYRPRPGATIHYSQLSQTRQVGSPPHARLSSNASDGPASV